MSVIRIVHIFLINYIIRYIGIGRVGVVGLNQPQKVQYGIGTAGI